MDFKALNEQLTLILNEISDEWKQQKRANFVNNKINPSQEYLNSIKDKINNYGKQSYTDRNYDTVKSLERDRDREEQNLKYLKTKLKSFDRGQKSNVNKYMEPKDFNDRINLIMEAISSESIIIDRYNDSTAIMIAPKDRPNLHLYIFCSDIDKYSMDLIDFTGIYKKDEQEEYFLSELEQYLGTKLEDIDEEQMVTILKRLGMSPKQLQKVYKIRQDILEG